MTTATGRHMINLGPVNGVPLGEGQTFRIGQRDIAVFRLRTGELFATQAQCSHRGGPLADGIVGAGSVICPLHTYKFALATGQPIGNDCLALRTYPVSVNETGDILITLEG